MQPHPTKPLRAWLLPLLTLDLVGLALVVGMWALMGGGEAGVGPYLRSVARASLSFWDLAVYCVVIAAFSAVLELALRWGLQERLHRSAEPWVRYLAIPATAVVYGLTHLIYHPAGVVYALLLGLASAAIYAYLRDWRALALWHVQWNAAAVAGAILLALWSEGDARTQFLFVYKQHQIEEGDLIYQQRWGWIDRTHYATEELKLARAWADGPVGEQLVIESRVRDMFGEVGRVTTHFERPARQAAPWALACAAVMEHNVAHERAQARSRWWGGANLSAFQADDLRSVLLACLDSRSGAPEEPVSDEPIEVLLDRWAVEGEAHVARSVREPQLPAAYHAQVSPVTAGSRPTRSQ